MTTKEVREDLKDIRYYLSRKKIFDESKDNIGANRVICKMDLYNELMRDAVPQLYDLYVSLYINNLTQEILAEKLNYSLVYISKLNSKLVKFLCKKINLLIIIHIYY